MRIIAAPVLAAVFQLPVFADVANNAAFVIFALASATDFLDGFFARNFNRQSRLGAFLDPIADKILVITALLLLLNDHRAPLIASIILICRSVFVSSLREWMAGVNKFGLLGVTVEAKWKTVVEMIAVSLLFYQAEFFGLSALVWGQYFLWLAAILSVHSMIIYLRIAWPHI